jgi:tight junction protein 1
VLGCRLFVKEVGSRCREAGLREGDVLVSINALPTDNMTLKEAKKLMDSTKERLNLVVSLIFVKKNTFFVKFSI